MYIEHVETVILTQCMRHSTSNIFISKINSLIILFNFFFFAYLLNKMCNVCELNMQLLPPVS